MVTAEAGQHEGDVFVPEASSALVVLTRLQRPGARADAPVEPTVHVHHARPTPTSGWRHVGPALSERRRIPDELEELLGRRIRWRAVLVQVDRGREVGSRFREGASAEAPDQGGGDGADEDDDHHAQCREQPTPDRELGSSIHRRRERGRDGDRRARYHEQTMSVHHPALGERNPTRHSLRGDRDPRAGGPPD